MLKGKKIVLLVVAYNEEHMIEGVLAKVPDYVDHVLLVDDCSLDNTSERARQAADEHGLSLEIVRHEVNRGSGAAHSTGFRKALEAPFDVLVCIDGDGQMDLRLAQAMVEPIVDGDVDATKANRLHIDYSWQDIPRVRLYGSIALSLMTKLVSGYWNVFDSQSGYFAMSRDCVEKVAPSDLFPRFGWPNDLLVSLNTFSKRLGEVATPAIYNIGERSKLKPFKVALPIFLLLTRLYVRRLFKKYFFLNCHPVFLFFMAGFLFSAVGLAGGVGIFLFDLMALGGIGIGNMIFFSLCIFIGVQFLMFSLLFDVMESQKLWRDL